ncbi:MAG: DUF2752 domain-containing protein [Sandaracinaceae bacterium]|nr:DUF2752 domain-containing protein [Sandaracinaceae bacterium]
MPTQDARSASGCRRHAIPVRPSSWLSRLGWFFFFIIPLAVVITATQLTPAAEGMGTTSSSASPPCGFLVIHGHPCPGCRLTTSFAHMVRGQFTGASRTPTPSG